MFRAYLGLIRKELIQIRRDSLMIRLIFIMPLVQMVVLSHAVNTDVKKIALDVYDYDRSQVSRQFIEAMKPNDYFRPVDMLATDPQPLWELEKRFKKGEAELAIILPHGFGEKLQAKDSVVIGLVSDGVDANAARTGIGYTSQIVRDFSQKITGLKPPISMQSRFLYNPEAESIYFMVPGIVAILLTMLTVMLTSMAIVREREVGTLEQVLVTPIKPWVLLLGKISTFAMLGLCAMGIALTVGKFTFGIPFLGSPFLLFGLAAIYLLTTLGIGMFFSTLASTQQQAMFLAWFFSVFAILTGGSFTPISNMPEWMQMITYLNPLRYFMEIVRGIMLKGSGFTDLLKDITPLLIYGPFIFSLAMFRFSRRVR